MGPVKHMGTNSVSESIRSTNKNRKIQRYRENNSHCMLFNCNIEFWRDNFVSVCYNSWKVIRIPTESLICKHFCPFLQLFAHFLLLFVDRQLILAAPHRARTFNQLFLFSPIWCCLLAKWSISANSNWGRSGEWFRQKFERCIWQEAATGLRILFSAPPWLDPSNIHGMRSWHSYTKNIIWWSGGSTTK